MGFNIGHQLMVNLMSWALPSSQSYSRLLLGSPPPPGSSKFLVYRNTFLFGIALAWGIEATEYNLESTQSEVSFAVMELFEGKTLGSFLPALLGSGEDHDTDVDTTLPWDLPCVSLPASYPHLGCLLLLRCHGKQGRSWQSSLLGNLWVLATAIDCMESEQEEMPLDLHDLVLRSFYMTAKLLNRVEDFRITRSIPTSVACENALFSKEDLATAKFQSNINKLGGPQKGKGYFHYGRGKGGYKGGHNPYGTTKGGYKGYKGGCSQLWTSLFLLYTKLSQPTHRWYNSTCAHPAPWT